MLQQSDTDAHWQDVLARIQTDSQFRQFKKFLYYGEVGGTRVGAVIANKNLQYTSYALNKGDFDRLLAAKQSGRVDLAFVVAVANGAYVTHHDAEEYAELLRDLTPRSGRFGEFWTLTEQDVTGEEAPF